MKLVMVTTVHCKWSFVNMYSITCHHFLRVLSMSNLSQAFLEVCLTSF